MGEIRSLEVIVCNLNMKENAPLCECSKNISKKYPNQNTITSNISIYSFFFIIKLNLRIYLFTTKGKRTIYQNWEKNRSKEKILAIHKYAPNNLFTKKKREKSNFTRTGGETYSVVAAAGDDRKRRRAAAETRGQRRERREGRDGVGATKMKWEWKMA
jgi:hypothetical protein